MKSEKKLPSSDRLYDPVQAHFDAVLKYRAENGEPVDGLSRIAWNTIQWTKKNPGKISASLVFLGATFIAFTPKEKKISKRAA